MQTLSWKNRIDFNQLIKQTIANGLKAILNSLEKNEYWKKWR